MNASELSCGHAHELAITTAKAGWELKDFSTLTQSEEKCRQVLFFLRGHSTIQLLDPLISCSTPVFIPEGWSVLPDSEQLPNRVLGQVKFDPSKVKLHLDEGQKNGKRIQGNELRKKLVNEPVYTAHILDYLLKPENQHLIPEEWKKKGVFFWGTIYRASNGNLYVRYLFWDGNRWDWICRWLDLDWSVYNPAVVSASPPDRTTSVVRAG